MKILITGGGGFLGTGMALPLAQAGHSLRLIEPRPVNSPHEVMAGDVTKLDDVRRAMQGMDAVILNHMAPREPNAYVDPTLSFDINVRGTANIFHVAAELGLSKLVMISTTNGKRPPANPELWRQTIPLAVTSKGLYQLTKGCQETIAQGFAADNPMQVSILRVGYILDGDQMQDKYGRKITERAPLDVDRRDIGEVARLCLERNDISLEVFPVMSTHEALDLWGVNHTVRRLGWQPRFDFDHLPLPAKKEPAKAS